MLIYENRKAWENCWLRGARHRVDLHNFSGDAAYLLFSSGGQILEFVPVPTEGEDEFAKALGNLSNVCLVFFIFTVIIWAGSIISSRGITLIKEIKLKIVEGSLGEEVEIVKKEKTGKAEATV